MNTEYRHCVGNACSGCINEPYKLMANLDEWTPDVMTGSLHEFQSPLIALAG